MYLSSTSLAHRLPPSAYTDSVHYQAEVDRILSASWHVVASWNQLSQHGDFVTLSLLGVPIQIRNFSGQLIALSNVCAHRHCLVTSAPRGNTPAMRCQYHGWEYGEDGRTRAIPAPKNFIPLDRNEHRLPSYRVERCGQLVFLSLASTGELREQLGDFYEVCKERFGDQWSQSLEWEPEYGVNWKIPIENSLESYHVPSIHAGTFRHDPGTERSTHQLLEHRTAFGTTLPFSPHSRIDRWFQSGETWFIRRLGQAPSGEYWQHHVFPNLLFSFTDAISLCHCVLPTGPRTSRGVIRQFGRGGSNLAGPKKWLARSWGWVAASITRQIVREDLGLFGDIQRGLEASSQRGVLGACEERIHAFQQYLADHCELPVKDFPEVGWTDGEAGCGGGKCD